MNQPFDSSSKSTIHVIGIFVVVVGGGGVDVEVVVDDDEAGVADSSSMNDWKACV